MELWYSNRSVSGSILSKLLLIERCINTGQHRSPPPAREISYTIAIHDVHFQDKRSFARRPLLRAGQSPVNRATKGPRPQGGLNIYMEYKNKNQHRRAERWTALTSPSSQVLLNSGGAHYFWLARENTKAVSVTTKKPHHFFFAPRPPDLSWWRRC